MSEDWNWPTDVKPGDTVIVPIPGKDHKTHPTPIFVLSCDHGMIVGKMPLNEDPD
jgi:hypothetical protein